MGSILHMGRAARQWHVGDTHANSHLTLLRLARITGYSPKKKVSNETTARERVRQETEDPKRTHAVSASSHGLTSCFTAGSSSIHRILANGSCLGRSVAMNPAVEVTEKLSNGPVNLCLSVRV
jgi:hypothetical protein